MIDPELRDFLHGILQELQSLHSTIKKQAEDGQRTYLENRKQMDALVDGLPPGIKEMVGKMIKR